MVRIVKNNYFLSLHRNATSFFLLSQKKKTENKKIKFGTKIEFGTIKGTDHPITKKD